MIRSAALRRLDFQRVDLADEGDGAIEHDGRTPTERLGNREHEAKSQSASGRPGRRARRLANAITATKAVA